jgi:hypothetical protein
MAKQPVCAISAPPAAERVIPVPPYSPKKPAVSRGAKNYTRVHHGMHRGGKGFRRGIEERKRSFSL